MDEERAGPNLDEERAVTHSDVPPPLPYSLWTRKKSIAFFWTIFVIDTLFQPIALYYGLWYGTHMSHNLVFSISTACLGGVSVFEYFYRFWNLWKKGSTTRPLNARRSWLDFFQINFTIVWLILAVELAVGTATPEPYVRLLAMPLPTVMYYFGGVYLSLDILRMNGVKAPFRISSTPRGSPMPAALYVMIEDIIAVDGGGGQKYRYALRMRYLSSPYFRRMLFQMNCFWTGGALAVAAGITAIVFTTPRNVAYTLGWALPFGWAILWTLITIPWVRSDLRREKKAWAEHRDYGGIPYTDDINAPTPLTRFESVQYRLPRLLSKRRQNRSSTITEGTNEDLDDKDEHIPGTDDNNAPTRHSPFESVQEHLPRLLSNRRQKRSAPATEGTNGDVDDKEKHIPDTDDNNAPTHRSRFGSIHEHLPRLLSKRRHKRSSTATEDTNGDLNDKEQEQEHEPQAQPQEQQQQPEQREQSEQERQAQQQPEEPEQEQQKQPSPPPQQPQQTQQAPQAE